MENIISLLRRRGIIQQISSPELEKRAQNPLKVYCGFDPTSDSLHLGNLVAMMGLAWFERLGHTPVVIVGGATGMIGDPSGKNKERQLLDKETISKNLAGITQNFANVLSKPVILNNLDWFESISFIDFLREVGKQFRMGTMLAKESVKARLESEEGMSFTEFSYQTLQAYDFLHLFDKQGVTVQIGGSDQWGNITAGQELIRKVRGEEVFGLTFPLLTTSTGQKFGKSEKGAIWLSAEKCSPYDFYQYLFRVADADVIALLYRLTFLSIEEIEEIERSMSSSSYVPNSAQKKLAEEVTRIVHGQAGLDVALKVTEGAKPGSKAVLDASILEAISHDMHSVEISRSEVLGQKLVDLFVRSGLQSSKTEARKLIKQGGAYVNNEKIDVEDQKIEVSDLIDGKLILLGVGKKQRVLIRVL